MYRLKEIFIGLVRDVNTMSPDYKKRLIPMLTCIMSNYLDTKRAFNEIYEYKIVVDRVGQSKIIAKIQYKERFYSPIEELEFEERLLTPREIRKKLLTTAELEICRTQKQKQNYENRN